MGTHGGIYHPFICKMVDGVPNGLAFDLVAVDGGIDVFDIGALSAARRDQWGREAGRHFPGQI